MHVDWRLARVGLPNSRQSSTDIPSVECQFKGPATTFRLIDFRRNGQKINVFPTRQTIFSFFPKITRILTRFRLRFSISITEAPNWVTKLVLLIGQEQQMTLAGRYASGAGQMPQAICCFHFLDATVPRGPMCSSRISCLADRSESL